MSEQEQNMYAKLLTQLDEMGFYKYAKRFTVEEFKSQTLNGGVLFNPLTFRYFPFDAEFLAEGGIAEYLDEISPALDIFGVKIKT